MSEVLQFIFQGGRIVNKTLAATVMNVPPKITVPAGKRWLIMGFCVDVVSSATVGNRQIGLSINDGDTDYPVQTIICDQLQAASLTRSYRSTAGATPEDAVTLGIVITLACPLNIILEAGDYLQVYDVSNISNTGDTAKVRVLRVLEVDVS